MDTFERIRELLAEQLAIDEDKINKDVPDRVYKYGVY